MNRHLKALKLFILSAAITHLTLLTIYSIKNWTLKKANYFDILDLDLFFPKLNNTNIIVSIIAVIAVYTLIYLVFTKENKKINNKNNKEKL